MMLFCARQDFWYISMYKTNLDNDSVLLVSTNERKSESVVSRNVFCSYDSQPLAAELVG